MQILWLAQAATDRAVTIHSCRFYFTKSKKALRSNFGQGERKANRIRRIANPASLFLYLFYQKMR